MRSHHDLLSFKKGAFHTAVQAGVPVPPLYVKITGDYTVRVTSEVVCSKSGVSSRFTCRWTRLSHPLLFLARSLVLPPISTTSLTTADVGDLAARTREQMLEALRDISEPTERNRKQPPKKDAISASQMREDARTNADA